MNRRSAQAANTLLLVTGGVAIATQPGNKAKRLAALAAAVLAVQLISEGSPDVAGPLALFLTVAIGLSLYNTSQQKKGGRK